MATGRDRADNEIDRADRRGSEKIRDKTMAAALKILASRARSENQLRERLLAKPWADREAVEDCIARLKELGYVNDSRFAHGYASSRLSLRAVGRGRLTRELRAKRVSEHTIDEALDLVFDEVGEESLIDRAIRKRIRTHGRPTDRASAKRMFDHLARLGFQYDIIMRKLRALKAEVEQEE